MIRTNLSTRPFYDQGAVHTWVLVGAILVAVATVFNVSRVLRYSRSDTQLAGEAARDEARAAELRQQAYRLRSTVDPKQIDFASNEARQANDLIDRRMFSWTELFNRFEMTLPDEVRITSSRPRIDPKRGTVVTITVAAMSVDDVNQFIDRLEATGAFDQLVKGDEHLDENQQNLWLATLEGVYKTDAARPAVEGTAR